MNVVFAALMVLYAVTVYTSPDLSEVSQPPSSEAQQPSSEPAACDGVLFKQACVKKGDIVEFGRYFQSNEKEKEPLRWRILDIEQDKNALFLLSEYVIDAKPFDDKKKNDINVTWKKCTLRKWLNDGFMKEAFDNDEKSQILTTHLAGEETDEKKGATDDKVFLLSGYDTLWGGWQNGTSKFDSDEAEKAIITKYAYQKGALVCSKDYEGYECDIKTEAACNSDWWLRSVPNDNPLFVGINYFENMDGIISDEGCVRNTPLGVRPAMRIKY